MRNSCHRDVISTVSGKLMWGFMKTVNPQVTP